MALAGENQNPSGDSQNSGGDGQQQNAPGAAGAPGAPGQPGSNENEYLSFFPEDIRGEKTLTKFKGKDKDEVLGKLAKSYVNLEKFQIPGDNAGPEEIKKFRQRLGVPESPDGYEYTVKPPEGLPWNTTLEGAFKSIAHEAGLTPKQHQAVMEGYLKLAQSGFDGATSIAAEELKKSQAALQDRWGGGYERNVGLVHRTIAEVGGSAFENLLETQVVEGVKLGNHPVMLEALAAVGERLLEHGYISGDNLLVKSNDAQASIQKVLDDKDHPYWKGDKAAVAQMRQWYAIAFPDKK